MSISSNRFSINDPMDSFNSGGWSGYNSGGGGSSYNSGNGSSFGGLGGLTNDLSNSLSGGLSSILGGMQTGGSNKLTDMLGSTLGVPSGIMSSAVGFFDSNGMLDKVFGASDNIKSSFKGFSQECLDGMFGPCYSNVRYARNADGSYRQAVGDCDIQAMLNALKRMDNNYAGSSYDPCSLTSLIQGTVKKAAEMGLDGVYDVISSALGNQEAAIAAGVLLASQSAKSGDWNTTSQIAGNGYASSVGAAKDDLVDEVAQGYTTPVDAASNGTAKEGTNVVNAVKAYDPNWTSTTTAPVSSAKVSNASTDFVKAIGSAANTPSNGVSIASSPTTGATTSATKAVYVGTTASKGSAPSVANLIKA